MTNLVGQICDYQQVTRYISETLQDIHIGLIFFLKALYQMMTSNDVE